MESTMRILLHSEEKQGKMGGETLGQRKSK